MLNERRVVRKAGGDPCRVLCCRGVNRIKSVDASTLGLPELGLTTRVRCVVSSTEGRDRHPP